LLLKLGLSKSFLIPQRPLLLWMGHQLLLPLIGEQTPGL
jgi:hypothetical protein